MRSKDKRIGAVIAASVLGFGVLVLSLLALYVYSENGEAARSSGSPAGIRQNVALPVSSVERRLMTAYLDDSFSDPNYHIVAVQRVGTQKTAADDAVIQAKIRYVTPMGGPGITVYQFRIRDATLQHAMADVPWFTQEHERARKLFVDMAKGNWTGNDPTANLKDMGRGRNPARTGRMPSSPR